MKYNLIQTLSIVCSLCLGFSFANAQNTVNGTIPPGSAIFDGQLDGNPDPETQEFTCNKVARITIYVANLIPVENPTPFPSYIFPYDIEPIYLRYIIGGDSGIIPVGYNNFKPSYLEHPSGLTLFSKVILVGFDAGYACPSNELPYEFELVTQEGAPYPFYQNDAEEEIFSCLIFCENCDNNDDSPSSATESCVLPQYAGIQTGIYDLNCIGCNEVTTPTEPNEIKVSKIPPLDQDPPNNELEGGEGMISNNSSVQLNIEFGSIQETTTREDISAASEMTTTVINKKIEVVPNPFESTTNISFETEQSEELEIYILDISGKQIFSQQIAVHKGINKITLSTNSWQSGIYYGHLKSSDRLQSFKMLKL